MAQALASAVAQVNGLFLQQNSSFETFMVTHLVDERLSTEVTDTFTETITQNLTGYVVDFEVLEWSLQQQVYSASLRVTVCEDPRLLLAIRGNAQAAPATLAALVEQLSANGWRVVVMRGDQRLGGNAVFESGATIALEVSPQVLGETEHRGIFQAEVEIAGLATDYRSGSSPAAFSVTAQGSDTDSQKAIHQAASEAARVLANRFSSSQIPTTPAATPITFEGVTRQNTVREIEVLLASLSGLNASHPPRWDGSTSTLTVHAILYESPCSLSDKIAASRRIFVIPVSCTAERLAFKIARE